MKVGRIDELSRSFRRRAGVVGEGGFPALGEALSKSPRSLMRMLSAQGNPQARNLFEIVAYHRRIDGTVQEVQASAA